MDVIRSSTCRQRCTFYQDGSLKKHAVKASRTNHVGMEVWEEDLPARRLHPREEEALWKHLAPHECPALIPFPLALFCNKSNGDMRCLGSLHVMSRCSSHT